MGSKRSRRYLNLMTHSRSSRSYAKREKTSNDIGDTDLIIDKGSSMCYL